ncbi:hemicentin-1 isoform X2 [Nematostella vectensis]|uniref:hemicentin-1 isoform X2 n=1 Tax=Nematostella vectensis TaxID=45351 RepID=UPI0020778A79|nr:hemicentin-1 isoform X2 [Nematostella vectensis]
MALLIPSHGWTCMVVVLIACLQESSAAGITFTRWPRGPIVIEYGTRDYNLSWAYEVNNKTLDDLIYFYKGSTRVGTLRISTRQVTMFGGFASSHNISTTDQATLIIKNATLSDAGNYSVELTDADDGTTYIMSVVVNVQAVMKFTGWPSSPVTIPYGTENHPLKWTYLVEGKNLDDLIYFYKKTTRMGSLRISTRQVTMFGGFNSSHDISTTDQATLIIKNATMSDAGNYSVELTDATDGTKYIKSVIVRVEEFIKFTSSPSSPVTVEYGKLNHKLKWSYLVGGRSLEDLIYFFKGSTRVGSLRISSRQVAMFGGFASSHDISTTDQATLIIKNATMSDAGNYSVELTDATDGTTYIKSVIVRVEEILKITSWPQSPVNITYGAIDYLLKWTYVVGGRSLDDLIYFYKGSTIVGSLRISSRQVAMFGGFASSHDISTTDQATLIIKNATMSDAGNYSVELTDATDGTTYIKSVIVRVEAFIKFRIWPSSPVTITQGTQNYQLKWTYLVGGRNLEDLIYFYKGSTRIGSLRISTRQVTMFGGFASSHDISTTDQATLIIKNATMSDAGNYSVELTDATDGTTYIKSVIVRVEGFASFTSSFNNPVYILKGTLSSLKWTYRTTEAIDRVVFWKDGVQIGELSNNTKLIRQGFGSSLDISESEQATLIIKNATQSDEGVYQCEIIDINQNTYKQNATVKFTVPLVVRSNGNVTVNETESTVLSCSVSEDVAPPPSVTWSRDGQQRGAGDSLTISSAGRADTGSYRCTARSGNQPVVSDDVYLNVQYKATNVTLRSSTYITCVNQEVALSCTGTSNPSPYSYDFVINEKTYTSNTGTLTHNPTAAGVMHVTCVPQNRAGPGENATVEVLIKAPPMITRPTPSQTAVEGANVTLVCDATGSSPLNTTWLRDGRIVASGENLLIPSIGRDEEGEYVCQAENSCSAANSTAQIQVDFKPENLSLTLTPSIHRACQGQSVQVTCSSKAKPAANHSLYLNGEIIAHSVSGGLGSTVRLNNSGSNVLRCDAQNKAGSDTETINSIEIEGIPVITSKQSSLTFNNGGQAFLHCNATGYPTPNVTWIRLGDGRQWLGSPIVFSNISRGDEGVYRCTASTGDECRNATLDVDVIIDIKPENLSLTLTPSIHRACQGQSVQVTCLSTAKPAANHSLYLNGELIAHTVSGGLGSTVRLNNSGSNVFRCDAQNKAGSDTETIDSIEIEGIPVITSKLSSLTFNEGDQASFHCNATGFPTPNVTWIRLGDGRQWLGSPIVFPNISRGDEGVYRCTASTGDECRNATLDIDVIINTKPKDTILTKSIGSAVCVNSSMRLSCISTSKPAATKFTFYKDNVEIANTSSGNITVTLSTQGTHQFTCVPENVAGTGENATVTVLVKGVPVITSKKTSLTFNEGESATLNCNATGYPTPEVTLIRLEDGRQWFGSQIVFQNISREYDGVYRCVAISGAECRNVTLDVHVSVNSKPENTSLIKSVGSAVCVNSSMRLSCTSASKPATTKFTFYKNGVEIANTSSGNITFTLSTQGTHRFSCVPENVAGTGAIATVTVLVKAPPVIAPFTASQFTVNETSDFSLHCDVTGSPPVNITWSRHGEPLLVQGAWLNMTSVTPVHEGVYTCRADNGDECASHERSVQIAVNFKPRNTTLLTNASDVTVLQGKSLALSCESRSKPSSCDFTFYQDDVALVTLPGICEEGSVTSHVINSVRGCGNTTFACLSKNMISEGSWSNITLEIQDPPTTAISPDADRTLNIGDNLQLNCSATGCPIPTLTWLKGSQIIARGRGFALPINISNAQLSDEGEYRCIADNGVSGGHPRQQIRVFVNKPDNISLTLSPSIHRACQGQSVLVTCSSTAKPAANHSLYLNEVKIGQTVSENLSQSVRLNSTGPNMFRCVSQTSTGSAVNITHSIEVEGIPVITSEQSSHSFNEGDQASLYCNATGYPTPNINWTRLGDGRQWFGSPILFPNISRGEAGVYRCTASTGDQCRNATLDVNVIVKSSSQIVSVSVQPALTQVRKNETVTLECITSLPSPHVTWFDVQGVVIGNQSSLVFVATNTSSGVYTCAVRSTAGRTVNSSAVVLVQSPVYTVYCIIKLPNETFQGALSDPTSDLYKNQAAYYQILLSGWFEEYANNTGVANVTVTGFGNGSLVVEFTLTMLAYARDPLLPLRLEAARNRGYINGTLVDLIYYFPLAMPVLYNITLQTHGLAFIWAYPKAPLLAQCKADVSRLHDASVQRTCEIEGSTGKLSCAVDRLDPGKRHVVYITCRNEFGFNNITTYAKTIDVVSCPPEDEVNRIIMGFAIAGGILIFIIFMVVCCYACRAEEI